jgi:hypothetical protein
MIAFDGKHSCDPTGRRDPFAMRAIIRVQTRFVVRTPVGADCPDCQRSPYAQVGGPAGAWHLRADLDGNAN